MNLINDGRSNEDTRSDGGKSTLLPTIKVRGDIESGQAEVETGLPESTAPADKTGRSFHIMKKSIDVTQTNASFNNSFISHEPGYLGDRNSQLLQPNRYKSKITSMSQISGGHDNIG